MRGEPPRPELISCKTQAEVRYFNTEGPVEPEEHYCIPPLARLDMDEIRTLVERKKYFVLHAPRQTGKTSTLEALEWRLNADGTYHCLYINVEPGQALREHVSGVERIILAEFVSRARTMLPAASLQDLSIQVLGYAPAGFALHEFLARWSATSTRPLVLLVDEIDSLVGDSLISVLRQLRSGYNRRPRNFPQTVVLCGVRDVRDYRIYSSSAKDFVSGGSAFNIRAKSLRLRDFTKPQVNTLLAQHTAETKQAFHLSAAKHIWELTRGQPWLVNALAFQACFKEKAGRNRNRAIDVEAIDRAKESLILNRVTHLDQLAARLREPRVRRVIEPMLAGTEFIGGVPADDLDYLVDLGLVRIDGSVDIANPIYREVIPRELTYSEERFISGWPEGLADRRKSLNMETLLEAFPDFYRRHSGHWVKVTEYKEAGPQLLLQAFLQRVVNSGGRMEREYALGRGRTDLLVLWPESEGTGPAQGERHVIECKVLRPGRGLESTVQTALEQTTQYMDRCRAGSGHVVIFDRRPGKTWEQRLFRRDPKLNERPITVWGM